MSSLRICFGRSGRVKRSSDGNTGDELERLSRRYLDGVPFEYDPSEGVVRGYVKIIRHDDEQFYAEYIADEDDSDPILRFKQAIEEEVDDAGWRIDRGGGENQKVFDAIGEVDPQWLNDLEIETVDQFLTQGRQVDFTVPDGRAAMALLEYLRAADTIGKQYKYVIANGEVPDWLDGANVTINIDSRVSTIRVGPTTSWYLEHDAIEAAKSGVQSALTSLTETGESRERIAQRVNAVNTKDRTNAYIKPSGSNVGVESFERYGLLTGLIAIAIALPLLIYLTREPLLLALVADVAVPNQITGYIPWISETYSAWHILGPATVIVTIGAAISPTVRDLVTNITATLERTATELFEVITGSQRADKSDGAVTLQRRLETLHSEIDRSQYVKPDGDSEAFYDEAETVVTEYGYDIIPTTSIQKQRLGGGAFGAVFATGVVISLSALTVFVVEPSVELLVSGPGLTLIVAGFVGGAIIATVYTAARGFSHVGTLLVTRMSGPEPTHTPSVDYTRTSDDKAEQFITTMNDLKKWADDGEWQKIKNNTGNYEKYLEHASWGAAQDNAFKNKNDVERHIARYLYWAEEASDSRLLEETLYLRIQSILSTEESEPPSHSSDQITELDSQGHNRTTERVDSGETTNERIEQDTVMSQQNSESQVDSPENDSPSISWGESSAPQNEPSGSTANDQSRPERTNNNATNKQAATNDRSKGVEWGNSGDASGSTSKNNETQTHTNKTSSPSVNSRTTDRTQRSQTDENSSKRVTDNNITTESKRAKDGTSGTRGRVNQSNTLEFHTQFRVDGRNSGHHRFDSNILTGSRSISDVSVPPLQPIVTSNRFYVSDERGTVHAYSIGDHDKKWTTKIESTTKYSPTATTERLYFPSSDGRIKVINANDGTIMNDEELRLNSECIGPVSVHNRKVYAGCSAGYTYCFESGTKQWEYRGSKTFVTKGPEIVGKPAVDNKVAIALASGAIEVLSLDGKHLSTYGIDSQPAGGPVIDGDYIYVCDTKGTVYRIGDSSMALGSIRGVQFPPAVDEQNVYIAGQNQLAALNKTNGDRVWTENLSCQSASPPVVDKSNVHVVDARGNLRVLDASTGERIETCTIGKAIREPVLHPELSLIAFDDGIAHIS